MKHITIIMLWAGLLAILSGCGATDDVPEHVKQAEMVEEPLPEIGIYEHLDDHLPEGLVFRNENDEEINLSEWIDKPTVLSFVYFDCPGLCSPLLDGMVDVVGKTDLQLGKDYQVATISFDNTDSPEKAQQKKENFTGRIELGEHAKHWQYLTTNPENIEKVTDAVGFKFKQEGQDFVHAAALVVVSPEGKITRYLHGTKFLPFDLKMAVIEAQKGQSRPTISKVLQYCFSYDAEGKTYVLNITKISGTIILAFAVSIFLFLVFAKPIRRRRAPAAS